MVGHYDREAERKGYHRDNIDPSRTAQNFAIGASSPDALADTVRARVDQAVAQHEESTGKRIRKDANVLSDWVITLPKDCPREKAAAFFQICVTAVQARYGKENVPGGFVHLDETTPHVHIPVIPVKDGRLRASKVFTRSDLQGFHSYIGKACDTVLGFHVSIELDPADAGAKQLSHLKQKDYKLAKDELSKAQEMALRASERAAEANEKAYVAERAQKAAEDRRRAAEAAAEASEKARAQASDAAKEAKEDMQRQRDFAKRLGNQGKGIDWHYPDGHVEHESSVGEVRAERDAAKAEAAAAMKKKDELLAMADELKGLRANCAAAKNELAAAQDKAAAARRAAAEAEAAKAQAEALLSKIQDSVRQSQEAARALSSAAEKARQERDRYGREKYIDWPDIDSAIAGFARLIAYTVIGLWDAARDYAIGLWGSWCGEWGRAITAKVGYSEQYHEELSTEQMASACEERNRPDIARALGVGEERGYDDWER